MNTNNEILELSAKEIWNLINPKEREIRIIGGDGKKHCAHISFWKTKAGKDSVTINWTENEEEHGCDLNNQEFFPVEVVSLNEEYIIWWYNDIAIHFVFVQPSL